MDEPVDPVVEEVARLPLLVSLSPNGSVEDEDALVMTATSRSSVKTQGPTQNRSHNVQTCVFLRLFRVCHCVLLYFCLLFCCLDLYVVRFTPFCQRAATPIGVAPSS